MKKIVVAFLTFVTLAFSADVTIQKMNEMNKGLQDIQEGFLYNDMNRVAKGTKAIRVANKLFLTSKHTKAYLPKDRIRMEVVAINLAKRLDRDLEDMQIYLESKHYGKASEMYSDVIKSCLNCHAIVRGW
jgi:hypothetical protein